ncbi:unnamed protein product [Ilex paraguariensis]|uniref:Uncharacterized protein n=1 Tax=Ilex paraguariensis TaxID=185542 RepID=A0ABC8RKQ3_9AQUA
MPGIWVDFLVQGWKIEEHHNFELCFQVREISALAGSSRQRQPLLKGGSVTLLRCSTSKCCVIELRACLRALTEGVEVRKDKGMMTIITRIGLQNWRHLLAIQNGPYYRPLTLPQQTIKYYC